MVEIIPLEEAKIKYAEYFQENRHKCIEYTTADEWLFESGKVAKYIGVMAKGAARRFYMTDMDTYKQDRGVSYNFYYKNLTDTSDNLGDPIIPPLSLLNDTPEQFYLELVRTKIVAEPMAFLMPIDVFRQDVQANQK